MKIPEAESGVMRPQAEKCQQPPEAGRGKGWTGESVCPRGNEAELRATRSMRE